MSINWYEITRGDQQIGPHDVMQIVPHRYPFLLIDKVLEIRTAKPLTPEMNEQEQHAAREGSIARAVKNITFNEPQFNGHFPGFPIFPGVLTIEAMCQTALFVTAPFLAAAHGGKIPKMEVVLAGIDEVRFRKPIVPGDQMFMNVKLKKSVKSLWSFEGVAEVDGKTAAEGSFMAYLNVPKGEA